MRSFVTRIQHDSHAYTHNLPKRPTYQILGKSSINPLEPHFSGQIANDPLIDSKDLQQLRAVDCHQLTPEYLQFILDFSKKYTLAMTQEVKSPDRVNAIFAETEEKNQPVLNGILMAHREIKAGEEIYISYGLGYWMNIPMNLCEAHGFPENTQTLLRAASAGVEQIALETQQDPKKLYSSYITEADNQQNQAILSSAILTFKIASLFGPNHLFQIVTKNTVAFLKMADILQIQQKLDEIAHLPNDQFYTSTHWSRIHPKSRGLLNAMVTYQQKAQQEPGLEDRSLFSLVNVLTQKALTDEELNLLLKG